jgi:hypothetical protein
VKPLIPSEHPEKAFFATQEPFLQSERTILPSEPSKLLKSPQNAIFGNKKADRITPIGSHTCHVLDRDVAELYGVETRRINEALKNNPEKFPDGYVIELTDKEKQYVVENFDHLEKLKYSHVPTKAFTEKGLYFPLSLKRSFSSSKL